MVHFHVLAIVLYAKVGLEGSLDNDFQAQNCSC